MNNYDTFNFDFEIIREHIKPLLPQDVVLYLKWIIKEYNLAERPHKKIDVRYKTTYNRADLFKEYPETKEHRYITDKFYEKIKTELDFYEDIIKNNNVPTKDIDFSLDHNDKSIESIIKKNKVFICYSQVDSSWIERIKVHIKTLQYEGIDIDLWDDTKLNGGDLWKKEISKALSESFIAILLVSTSFLASDFVRNDELPVILEKASKNETIIQPLIIAPCRFLENESLSKYHAINNPKTEILTELDWSTQEKFILKLMEKIVDIIKKYSKSRQIT